MSASRGFTMIEMLLAVLMVGVLTVLSMLTFKAVTNGWMISQEYLDKRQRTDYALSQVISALRSMYYPHDGEQNEKYGFQLTDNGDGENPRSSDTIEWSKTGTAIVGNKSAIADTVHRVQVMVLEEGNSDYKEPIQITGLYARLCRDSALIPSDEEEDSPTDGYGFGNEELYQPILIADGIVGFNCRILKKAEDAQGGIKNESENDKDKFEDEFSESNSVPYKVELTFHVQDPDGKSYRSNTAPVVRIVRIPIHEQSLDGATTPTSDDSNSKGGSKTKGGGKNSGGGGGALPPAGGGP